VLLERLGWQRRRPAVSWLGGEDSKSTPLPAARRTHDRFSIGECPPSSPVATSGVERLIYPTISAVNMLPAPYSTF